MLFCNADVLLTSAFLLCSLTCVWGERNRPSLVTNHLHCLSLCQGRSFVPPLAAAFLPALSGRAGDAFALESWPLQMNAFLPK